MKQTIFIPHSQAPAYTLAGWTVIPLKGHHSFYSMLAWRWV